ncbi:hypothetical protein ACLMJK_005504 [Lecanora helva]
MAGTRLDGTALIIGAAGAIGKETAYAFAEAGAKSIALVDLNEQGMEEVVQKSRKYAVNSDFQVIQVAVNITDPSSVQRMVDTVVQQFERIDYCVNAAGLDNDVHEAIYDSSLEDFDNVLNANAKGVLTCTRAVSKTMLAQAPRSVTTRNGTRDVGRGSIVNLGSANSYAALPGKVAYVASKHAMMGITKTAGE